MVGRTRLRTGRQISSFLGVAGLALAATAVAVTQSAGAAAGPVVVARSAFSTNYVNSDGSNTVDLADAPVNYQTGSGAWAPIDNSLTPDGAGGFVNTANSWHVDSGQLDRV